MSFIQFLAPFGPFCPKPVHELPSDNWNEFVPRLGEFGDDAIKTTEKTQTVGNKIVIDGISYAVTKKDDGYYIDEKEYLNWESDKEGEEREWENSRL